MLKLTATVLVVIALVAAGLTVFAPDPASPSTAVRQVSFSTSDPTDTISMNSTVVVTYQDQVDVYDDGGSDVSYDLQPDDLVITLNLRLSSLGLGLQDESVTVSVADTQLLDQEISLTQYLTSVPAALASIDMVIRTKVSMVQPVTSSPACTIAAPAQALAWSQWGSKTFQVDSLENGWIRTGLTYQLSVAVVADALDLLTDRLSVTLVPDTVLTSTSGSDPLVTTVSVGGARPATSSPDGSLVMVGIAATAMAAVVVLTLMLTRRTTEPRATDPPRPVPVMGCERCGQHIGKDAAYCPRCGTMLR